MKVISLQVLNDDSRKNGDQFAGTVAIIYTKEEDQPLTDQSEQFERETLIRKTGFFQDGRERCGLSKTRRIARNVL